MRKLLFVIVLLAFLCPTLSAQFVQKANRAKALTCTPAPAIVYPEPNQSFSDIGLVLAQDARDCQDDPVLVTTFEFTPDGANWFEFGMQESIQHNNGNMSDEKPRLWESSIDMNQLQQGPNEIRCVMHTAGGKVLPSASVLIFKNEKPIGDGQAQEDQFQPGLVHFDAANSFDLDGSIVSYEWDFGDGNTASGIQVSHQYADLNISYQVILTVTDNLGAFASVHYEMLFNPGFIWNPFPFFCICLSIELIGDDWPDESSALGPDAKAGGGGWPAWRGWDGTTLGPLWTSGNNPSRPGGKFWTGYAFEVVATVFGIPALCPEMQLVRGTIVDKDFTTQAACEANGGTWNATDSRCEFGKAWAGTSYDNDLDGVDDVDVSTPQLCEDSGGTWNANLGKCILRLGLGDGYLPDAPRDDLPQGAYERPFQYKKYSGNKIIWADAPMFGGYKNNSRKDNDFIAIVRGTDGKYCYTKFELRSRKRSDDPDFELLTETDNAAGADSVPGL